MKNDVKQLLKRAITCSTIHQGVGKKDISLTTQNEWGIKPTFRSKQKREAIASGTCRENLAERGLLMPTSLQAVMDGELKKGEVCLDSGRQAAKDYIPRECVSTAAPERSDSLATKAKKKNNDRHFCFVSFLILPRGPQIKGKKKNRG